MSRKKNLLTHKVSNNIIKKTTDDFIVEKIWAVGNIYLEKKL